MIERLELRRWRSFDHVAIDFEPGTTFLVAPNGVGKTSLLTGLTWALFGDHSNVDASTNVRIGHETAEAIVTIVVGDNLRLVIHRSVTAAGKSNVEYSDGDKPIEASIAHELLADEFGAPLEIAARLAVIRGSGKDAGELVFREHLYDAFGVSGLRRAAAITTKLHKQAEASRKKLRSASRTQLANRDQLAELSAKLSNDLDQLNVRRASLIEAVAALQLAQRAVISGRSMTRRLRLERPRSTNSSPNRLNMDWLPRHLPISTSWSLQPSIPIARQPTRSRRPSPKPRPRLSRPVQPSVYLMVTTRFAQPVLVRSTAMTSNEQLQRRTAALRSPRATSTGHGTASTSSTTRRSS